MKLIDGEYYWIKDLINNIVVIGKYNRSGWRYPVFDLCGDDCIHDATEYTVIEKVKKPDEN